MAAGSTGVAPVAKKSLANACSTLRTPSPSWKLNWPAPAPINNVKQGDKVDFTFGRAEKKKASGVVMGVRDNYTPEAINAYIQALGVPLALHKETRGNERATSKPLKEKA